jgi:hypothetical protein
MYSSNGNSPLAMPHMPASDMFLPGLGSMSPMQISPPDSLEFRGFMQGVTTQPKTFQPSQFRAPASRRNDELPELHSPRTMRQLQQPILRSSPEANFSPGGLSPMQISPSAFPLIEPPSQPYVQPRTLQLLQDSAKVKGSPNGGAERMRAFGPERGAMRPLWLGTKCLAVDEIYID